jgi:hypothetical protein
MPVRLRKIKKICQSKQNLIILVAATIIIIIIIIINEIIIAISRRRDTCTQKCHRNTSRSTGSEPFLRVFFFFLLQEVTPLFCLDLRK